MLYGDARLLEHFQRVSLVMVVHFAYNALDAAVDDEHGAGAARSHLAVYGGTVYGNAAFSSLTDGILLGMHRAYAVL